jgi:hypothetical protein
VNLSNRLTNSFYQIVATINEPHKVYLVQHRDAYWQSEQFGNIVQYAVKRPERCLLHEEKDKKGLPTGRRMVTIANVKTINGAITLLSKIERNEL